MSTTISRANKLSVLSPWLDAVNGDAIARRLAVQSVQVLLPLSKVCALVVEGELWRSAGASSLHDFTREQLERTGKWLRDHADLHDVIQRLPGLRAAVTGGEGGAPIGLCKTVLSGRVATEGTLAVWVERARRLTVGRLREAVREVQAIAAEELVFSDDSVVAMRGDGASQAVEAECVGEDAHLRAVEHGGDASQTIAAKWGGEGADRPSTELGRDASQAVAATTGGDGADRRAEELGSDANRAVAATSGGEDAGRLAEEVGCGARVGVVSGDDMCADAEPKEFSNRERLEAGDPLTDGRSRRPLGAGSQPDDLDDLPRVSWVIPVPPPVRAAFESALDLYRRVEGGDATVISFIESLVAEEFASDKPPDVFQAWLRAAEPPLDPQSPPSGMELPAMTVALEMLAQLDTVMSRAGVGTDSEVLWQLKCLAGAADMIERNLAALLIEMSDSGALRELGFASIGSYAENRLGLARTTVEDRVRVARALRGRKLLQRAYLDGAFGLEKALLVVQILGRGFVEESCEALWVSHLRACTVKRLRDEKRALLWASAVEGRTEAPLPMSDEAWLASLRCGPGDTLAAVKRAGHAACDGSPLVPVTGSMLRLRLPLELANDFSSCIEARRHHLSLDAASCDWSQSISDEDLPSWRAARTFSAASRRVPAWVGLLAMLEEFCAAYDVAEKRSASRSEVFVRSRHRCEAPGCTSRRVEWHHRHYKSRGGSDHHDNGDALCPTHHRRGQHGGYLHVSGDTPLQRIWRLGPAGSGAWYRNERRVVVVGR